MRLGHYFVGLHNAIYALLYSDDGKLTGRTDYPEIGILGFLLVLVLTAIPLSWKKVKGGQQVEWIGYALGPWQIPDGNKLRREQRGRRDG